MPIDDCVHDFATLAATVLPEHMDRVRKAMARPSALADFAKPKIGVAALLKHYGVKADYSGCYVFLDHRPIYVGISQHVFARLRQHVTDKTHFGASLAYRMAEKVAPHTKTRGDAMSDPTFAKIFAAKQTYLRGLHVAHIPIANPVELYVFEVYASMALDTPWNTFKTH